MNCLKKNGGFSYVEIIIALALFAVVVVAVFPALLQAGRNLAYAQEHYISHLSAQNIMLAVRDALVDGVDPEAVAEEYAAKLGVNYFSVWVFGAVNVEIHGQNSHLPGAGVDVLNMPEIMTAHSGLIISVIWNEYGNIAGRAVGVASLGLGDV